MAIITKPYVFTAGATIVAAEHNSNFDTIFNEFNGNIDNNNISAGASIVDTKLAQITTPNKISGAAITLLNSIPVLAGTVPVANLTGSCLTLSGILTATGLYSFTQYPLLPSVLPSDNNQACSKAYIDSNTNYGSLTAMITNTNYQATSDGFVKVLLTGVTGTSVIKVYVDTFTPPTTQRGTTGYPGGTGQEGSDETSVAKNEYWNATYTLSTGAATAKVWWRPKGS